MTLNRHRTGSFALHTKKRFPLGQTEATALLLLSTLSNPSLCRDTSRDLPSLTIA